MPPAISSITSAEQSYGLKRFDHATTVQQTRQWGNRSENFNDRQTRCDRCCLDNDRL